MITAEQVCFSYGSTPVLDRVDFTAPAGQVTGLVGPNGSGKTTLLRLLFGSLTPQSGSIAVDGAPLAQLSRAEIARRLAVVVQEDSGDTALTVAEVVLLGRIPHHSAFGATTARDYEIAETALRQVGATHLASRQLTELSGGERQRVMVARALTQQAPYLLLDEPTNHLDIHYQHEILQLVRLGGTTVVVLHDLNLAAHYCDHIVVLEQGRVVADGTPDDVLLPELVERVYRMCATRISLPDGGFQLLFEPLRPGAVVRCGPAAP